MLLSNADILHCQNGKWEILKDGYLGVEGDTIAYIGTQKPVASYGVEKDLSGHMVMAGLYNMHTHTPMTLLRGLGSGLPLDRWLHEAMFPIEAKLTAPDISVGSRLAMMEMLASGVVSFTDMYDQSRITVEEVIQAGMKANLNRPILGFDPAEAYEKNFRVQESLAFFRDCNGAGDGRTIADFAIHAEYTSYEALIRPYGEDCKRHGARMHLHLSETRKEHTECKQRYGKTPAKWFYDLGVFDSPTIAAHCVWVEPEDIALLKEKGVTCVHNPSSNMKLGSGFMPIQALMDHGVHLAIGTDGAASNNNQNMLEEIHLASILHNGYTNDPTIVNPDELLTMATINGAKAQGRSDSGELKVGYKADIIAIDLNAPHLMPVHDPLALLTYSAQACDVTLTMVNGRILYENGEFKTIDFDRVKYDLAKSMERLFN